MGKASTRRSMPGAFGHKQKRGPNGESLCRWCEKPVERPRRTYCSDDCVHEWRLRSDPGYLRRCVFKRDRGVCALCLVDTEKLRKQVIKALREVSWYPRETRDERLVEYLDSIGVKVPGRIPDHRLSLWDADHIVPVVEGGGECDLSNMRTLCVWCHRRVTADLARRRASQSEQVRLFQ